MSNTALADGVSKQLLALLEESLTNPIGVLEFRHMFAGESIKSSFANHPGILELFEQFQQQV
jgi:hypothetical protein